MRSFVTVCVYVRSHRTKKGFLDLSHEDALKRLTKGNRGRGIRIRDQLFEILLFLRLGNTFLEKK